MSRRQRGWSRWAAVAILFAACHVEASCGGKQLDMAWMKEFISSTLTTKVGIKPDVVTCPSSVKAKKGATFSCQATFGDVVATVTIGQDSDDADVTLESVTGLVLADKLEAGLSEMIGKKTNTHVKTSCGNRVRQAKAGDKFTCEAKDEAGSTYIVEVEVQDANGKVSTKIVSGPGVEGAATPEPPL